MKREIKEKHIKELKENFNHSDSIYLLNYKDMTVAQSVELRKIMRKNSYSFKVVKNRLAIRALKEQFPENLKQYFQQPTAIAFATQDPLGLARILRDFSVQNKVLTVKGGMIEGQLFAPERFDEILKIDSRDNLLGKIGYLMAFPLIKFATTWQAPLSQLGRLLSQLKTKK